MLDLTKCPKAINRSAGQLCDDILHSGSAANRSMPSSSHRGIANHRCGWPRFGDEHWHLRNERNCQSRLLIFVSSFRL